MAFVKKNYQHIALVDVFMVSYKSTIVGIQISGFFALFKYALDFLAVFFSFLMSKKVNVVVGKKVVCI